MHTWKRFVICWGLPTKPFSGFHEILRTTVEWLHGLELLAEDPDTEMPHSVLELVGSVLPGWDAEDLVEFLEGKFFGLGHEEEHQEPASEAPGGVPATFV